MTTTKFLFSELTKVYSLPDIERQAKLIANNQSFEWSASASHLIKASCDPAVSPSFRVKEANSVDIISKWVSSYFGGLSNRTSIKVSKPPKTKHDDALSALVEGSHPHLSREDIDWMLYSHRVLMSSENILGHALEEYLQSKLIDIGWHWACGSVLNSVDFVSDDMEYLQIKSRNNSENSSSKKARNGRDIKMWWRFNAYTGQTNWKELNKLVRAKDGYLSEDGFRSFLVELTKSNPRLLGFTS
ncbi:TPA: SinI family restriction endonuclease [Vibrio parahaemolyticus]